MVLRVPNQSAMVVRRSKRHCRQGRFRNDAGIEATDHRSVEVTPASEEGLPGVPCEDVPVPDISVHHTPPPTELLPTPRSVPDTDHATVSPPEERPDMSAVPPPQEEGPEPQCIQHREGDAILKDRTVDLSPERVMCRRGRTRPVTITARRDVCPAVTVQSSAGSGAILESNMDLPGVHQPLEDRVARGRGRYTISRGRGQLSERGMVIRGRQVSPRRSEPHGYPGRGVRHVSPFRTSPTPPSRGSEGDRPDIDNNPSNGSVESMTAMIVSLKEKNEEMSRTVNEMKIKLTSAETRLGTEQFTKKALTFAFEQKERKIAELTAENEALKTIHDQVMDDAKSMGKKRIARNIEEFSEEFPTKHLGLAFKVDKLIPHWAGKEVAELDHAQKEPQRLWTLRGEEVLPDKQPLDEHGREQEVYALATRSGKKVVPFDPISLAARGDYYTPSAPTSRLCLQTLCQKEVASETWVQVLCTEDERLEALRAVSSNATLVTKLRQSLSDACSLRKRTARDAFFASLGYERLQSRYGCVIDADLARKELEISTAKDNLLARIGDTDVLDYSWWRTAPIDKLRHRRTSSNEEEVVDNGSNGNLWCLRDDIRKKVFCAFLGYDPSIGNTPVECSILSLARLDAWLYCVLQLISPKESRGGHRQRVYADTFYKNLESSTAQLVGTVAQYVDLWNGEELRIPSSCQTTATRKNHVLHLQRNATVLLRSPTTGKYTIAVKSSWFREYVTSALGDVHDCVIASIADDFQNISLLGHSVSTYAFRTMPMPVLPVSDHAHDLSHERIDPESPESAPLAI